MGMNTPLPKHVELPEKYDGWEKVKPSDLKEDREFIRVDISHYEGGRRFGRQIKAVAWFQPPTPKPTLPEVLPGAVLGYTNKWALGRRAVKSGEYSPDSRWHIYGPTGFICTLNDSELLGEVNEKGFTVLVGGLPE